MDKCGALSPFPGSTLSCTRPAGHDDPDWHGTQDEYWYGPRNDEAVQKFRDLTKGFYNDRRGQGKRE